MRFLGTVFSFLTLLALMAAAVLVLTDDLVPPEWDPFVPLDITDPVTPVTRWKLQAALSGADECLAALETGAQFSALADFEHSAQCHIRTQVSLNRAGRADMVPIKTRCQTALRTAMWIQHGIQPAAQLAFLQDVTQLNHFSSYSCRPIRTTSGNGNQMSTHATAEAIDVAGVTLENGRRLTLLEGWNSPDAEVQQFFRSIRDSACTWFRTTLGPEFNRLHADHFHLQHTGWGTCR